MTLRDHHRDVGQLLPFMPHARVSERTRSGQSANPSRRCMARDIAGACRASCTSPQPDPAARTALSHVAPSAEADRTRAAPEATRTLVRAGLPSSHRSHCPGHRSHVGPCPGCQRASLAAAREQLADADRPAHRAGRRV